MYSLLQSTLNRALDLLYPPACGVCGAGGGFLCPPCRRALPVAAPPRCRRCWALTARGVCADCAHSPLDGVRTPYVLDAGARTLVHALKYRSLHALAQPMGELLADSFELEPLPADVVMPVPLHGRRRRSRGFNQSELLARVLARRAGLELDDHTLMRTRNTPQQTRTDDRARREENVRGAFHCRNEVPGRRVLLVDDVLTTGATLRECARTLRQAGARSVWALAFSHAD
jgi:ComF family protein